MSAEPPSVDPGRAGSVRADPLLSELAEVVGAAHVLSDPDARAAYETDWTGRWRGRARAVVRPADTGEVAGVLAACARHGVAVLPQGGNTGLVGGGVPRDGEVVVCLTRLDHLGPVDRPGREVTVGAGATLAAVHAHAAAAGLAYGVDLAARDTATIGGTIATDAGGIRVVRHGTTRAQVLGVEAVLADGTVLDRLGGGGQDRAGYDLAGMLVGSEGTLAVVTRARLALVEPAAPGAVALVAVSDVEAALEVQARVAAVCGPVEASELMTRAGLELVVAATGARAPFAEVPPVALLIEVDASGVAALTEVLAELLAGADSGGGGGVIDAVLGVDAADRARLWHLREEHTAALSSRGQVHKLDVVLPPAAIGPFLATLPSVVAAVAPAAQVVVFGHLGVGDLHVNLIGLEGARVGGGEGEGSGAVLAAVEDAVLGAVVAAGGVPWGEHGVGVHKCDWLPRVRGDGEVALLRAIKAALDPEGRLNPGVLLPPVTVTHPGAGTADGSPPRAPTG